MPIQIREQIITYHKHLLKCLFHHKSQGFWGRIPVQNRLQQCKCLDPWNQSYDPPHGIRGHLNHGVHGILGILQTSLTASFDAMTLRKK